MIIEKLEDILQKAFESAGYSEKCSVVVSNRPEMCDYQCDNSFKLAKNYHKSPLAIASEVVDKINELPNFSDFFNKVEFAPPGFINLSLSDKMITSTLSRVSESEHFGLICKSPKTYFLDYGGPNIAKPLHVGHLRSAIVGESVKRILAYGGNKTVCDVHLGDFGLQIGEVIYGLKEKNIGLKDITLELLETIYPNMSARCKEDEALKQECAQITKDLQDGNEEYRKYWEVICQISGDDIKRLYKYLDVNFDLWEGESTAYEFLPMLFEKYKNEGKIISSEGAYIIPVSKESDSKELPPLIFRKSNGAFLYGSTDIATIYERLEKYKIDNFLYFADLRQSLHFEQVFRSAEILNLAPRKSFEFCGFGTVNGADGKPFKTRAGDSPKLDSLFAQVKEVLIASRESLVSAKPEDLDILVNSIIKFADLQNNREKDYIFDIEKFSKIAGKTGPYVLYTYLRLNKILQNENPENFKFSNKIFVENERKLMLALLELQKYFKKASDERMPSYICDFVYNVCDYANTFYETSRVKTEENIEIKNSWLKLIDTTTKILKSMLKLLLIDIPSVM